MNVAVCDENSKDSECLIDMLKKYFFERELPVNIFGFGSGEDLLYEVKGGLSFDLVFLSVEHNSSVGIEFAYLLRAVNYRRELILVSSSVDFAVDGYEVGAAGYLPKPCEVLIFRKVMERISGKFRIDTYPIKHRNSIVRLPLSEIIYVESNNSKCTVHTSSGDNYTLYKHLNVIENELSDKCFLRCHRSFIVNMNCVAAVDDDFVMKSGERILIRKKSRKEIKDIFWNFLSQKNN